MKILHNTVSIIVLLFFVEPSITEDIDSDYDAIYPEDDDVRLDDLQSRSSYSIPKEPPHVKFMESKYEYVNFTLYTRKNPTKGIVFQVSHGTTWIDKLSSTIDRHFDRTKPSKFITHGWISSGATYQCTVIKNSLMVKYDANIFILDFSNFVKDYLYVFTTVPSTKTVAKFYSAFLNQLVDNHGADPKSFHLLGFSYGAHIAGFAARGVRKGKVGRVSAMDPAGPGFGKYGLLAHLVNSIGKATLHWFNVTALDHLDHMSRNDADFVDVIHTGAGMLGMMRRMGHADFYPNGGWTPQPGCENLMLFGEYACSHSLSWKMFVESVKHADAYKAYRCDSYKDFLNDRKNCSEDYVFMGDPVALNASGKYYLKTWYQIL